MYFGKEGDQAAHAWEEASSQIEKLHGRILNVGAGDGLSTLYLQNLERVREVVSLDLLPVNQVHHFGSFIVNVQEGDWYWGDVQNLPFQDKEFDCAVCWAMLQHVRRPEKALRELARVTTTLVSIFLHFRKGGSFDIGEVELGCSKVPLRVWCLWDPEELVDNARLQGLDLVDLFVNSQGGIHGLFRPTD